MLSPFHSCIWCPWQKLAPVTCIPPELSVHAKIQQQKKVLKVHLFDSKPSRRQMPHRHKRTDTKRTDTKEKLQTLLKTERVNKRTIIHQNDKNN